MPRDEFLKSDPRPAPPLGWVLFGFTLLLIVAVTHGVLAFGCYLVNEHRRLIPFETVLLWMGDVIGLFWFLRFVARWSFGEAGTESQTLNTRRFPKSVWIMLGTMLIGFLSELAATLALRHAEHAGFQRAVPAVCTLEKIGAERAQGAAATFWKLDGTYQDPAGMTHPVTYYLREHDELPKLPGALEKAIRQKKAGLSLPIVYDPKRPGRSWIPQLGWDDGNRLHYLSFLILLFQFLISLLFMVLLWEAVKDRKLLPWWVELHSLIPLGAQAFIMALFGGLELYIVRRLCP